MCLILSPVSSTLRLLDLEGQIIFFIERDFDVRVFDEEDLGELGSTRRLLAIINNLYFFSRLILEYNLPSLVECNVKLLTAESGTSLA